MLLKAYLGLSVNSPNERLDMLKIGQKRGITKKLNSRLSLSRRQQIRASDTRVLSKFMGFTLSVFGVFCTSNSLTLNQIAYPPQFLLQELL